MNVGGPAWQVSVLSRGLADHGYSTVLVTGEVGEGEADFITVRRPDIEPTVLRGLGRSIRPLDDLRALIRLVRLLRRERPTIVHTHTTKAGVLGRVAAVIARVPIRVHTFHGHLLTGYFSSWKVRLLVFVERVLARSTSALVGVGDQVRIDLLDAGIGTTSKFVVIGPGVADVPQKSAPQLRTEWGVPIDSPLILFVGRLTRIKRPDRLLEAHRRILVEAPTAHLVVVGEGDLFAWLQAESRDLDSRVHFVGWRDDAAALYGAADVVVLTSDNEGMPVSLIEAAMAGTPVVSTRVGSVASVVDDGVTGLLCDSTPEAIAESVLDLLRDEPRRSAMGRATRERAVNLFGTDRLIADHDELYRELLGEIS